MRHCYILRVFTRGDEGGNHLGVIMDVTSLDGQMMQQIAGELGFSESVFVDWREGGTPAARIFTPTTELPFAGHPLVGAGWVLNSMGPAGSDTIACAIGDIGISFDGEVSWIDVPLGQPVEEVGDSEARARRLA
ncbi:MAG: PhzF family phenazine biosynthesis protein, partial [Acidimicrobiia bacterium]|nr:PhzF family phenazine biosynthesis protein [Acidimicrobiia bacterium]